MTIVAYDSASEEEPPPLTPAFAPASAPASAQPAGAAQTPQEDESSTSAEDDDVAAGNSGDSGEESSASRSSASAPRPTRKRKGLPSAAFDAQGVGTVFGKSFIEAARARGVLKAAAAAKRRGPSAAPAKQKTGLERGEAPEDGGLNLDAIAKLGGATRAVRVEYREETQAAEAKRQAMEEKQPWKKQIMGVSDDAKMKALETMEKQQAKKSKGGGGHEPEDVQEGPKPKKSKKAKD